MACFHTNRSVQQRAGMQQHVCLHCSAGLAANFLKACKGSIVGAEPPGRSRSEAYQPKLQAARQLVVPACSGLIRSLDSGSEHHLPSSCRSPRERSGPLDWAGGSKGRLVYLRVSTALSSPRLLTSKPLTSVRHDCDGDCRTQILVAKRPLAAVTKTEYSLDATWPQNA